MSDQERSEAYAELLDQSWQRVSSQFPDAERPEVELVRYVDQNEWAEVTVSCLVEQGVDAKVSTDGQGGYEMAGVEGQLLPMEIAIYTCNARYPTDPALTLPLTEAELDFVYDYYVNVLNPCLENEGVEITEAPSRQAFIDTYGASEGWWTPYEAVGTTGEEDWNQLNRVCPQSPPGFRGT